MARGKHAAAANARRLREAQQRVADLEREVADMKAAARRREVEHKEALAAQGWEISRRTSERVQELIGENVEHITNGISAAAWWAQRVAMTEHLTWLFLKGYVTWDRFDGDREVLTFLATHGDLKAWFTLTSKHAHMDNYKDRRQQKKNDPVRQMLAVIQDIDRAKNGNADAQASRKQLDDVVDYARDAFVNVELRETLTDEGWQTVEPTEDEIAMHREVVATLPRFQQLAERVG